MFDQHWEEKEMPGRKHNNVEFEQNINQVYPPEPKIAKARTVIDSKYLKASSLPFP